MIRFFIILSLIFEINYLRWRITFLVNNFSYIALVYSICEILIMTFGTFNTYFIAWTSGRKLPIVQETTQRPCVEIIVCCCREPVEIILQTVTKLLDIDYPIEKLKITIADDGKSEELYNSICKLKEEFPEYNLNYKNRILINGLSKAGNINDTIFTSDITDLDSLILVLDCDMMCHSDILTKLVKYFYENDVFNKNIAFVQSHQNFYNLDCLDILGQRYSYFYQIIMPSWTIWGTTPCCGTNVLFSRKVLESVGGFQYGSVTEDFLTAMYIHSKGYTSMYCNETLADGLAPFHLDDFYKQRFRWALGGIQLMKYFPKVYKKLSFIQLWIYFNAAIFIFLTPFLIFLVCSILIISFFPHTLFGNIYYSYYFGLFIINHFIVLVLLFRPISYLYLLRSYQESIYMINCNFIVFIYAILNLPYSFKITSKAKKNKTLQSIFWCTPYLLYYGFVFYILFIEKKKLSTAGLGWLITICVQMFPPIHYAIRYR